MAYELARPKFGLDVTWVMRLSMLSSCRALRISAPTSM